VRDRRRQGYGGSGGTGGGKALVAAWELGDVG